MEREPGLKIRLLRVFVLLLLGVTSYQFGYAHGAVNGDWKELQRQIKLSAAAGHLPRTPAPLEVGPTDAVTARNDVLENGSPG